MNKNSGYVVVRLPAFVGEYEDERLPTLSGVQGQNIIYFGLDRDPWCDFNVLFYAGQLSDYYKKIRRNIIGTKLHSFSPGVCHELHIAQEILDISNQPLKCNEIIYISSLYNNLGAAEQPRNVSVLGLDCYADGFGSLLRLGLFQKEELFKDYLPILNSNGMFNQIEEISSYINTYIHRCYDGGLEPIDSKASITIYQVGRGNP